MTDIATRWSHLGAIGAAAAREMARAASCKGLGLERAEAMHVARCLRALLNTHVEQKDFEVRKMSARVARDIEDAFKEMDDDDLATFLAQTMPSAMKLAEMYDDEAQAWLDAEHASRADASC